MADWRFILLWHLDHAPGFYIANNDTFVRANDEDALARRIENHATFVCFCSVPVHNVPPRFHFPHAEGAICSQKRNATAVLRKGRDSHHVLGHLVCPIPFYEHVVISMAYITIVRSTPRVRFVRKD